jgi:hypothetical protein
LPACSGDLSSLLRQAGGAGFRHVDVLARADERPAEHLEVLADTGLLISSALLEPGQTLAAPDRDLRQAALARLCRQVNDAALLGATCVCLDVTAPIDPVVRPCLEEAIGLLARHAASRMVRLGLDRGQTDSEGSDPDVFAPENVGLVWCGRGPLRSQPVLVRLHSLAHLSGVAVELQGVGYTGVIALERW